MEAEVVFNESKKLLFTSRLVIWTWCWLALLTLSLPAIFVLRSVVPFFATLGIFLPSAIFYAILAFRIRCQNCNKFVTVQPMANPPYINENRIKGFNGWAGIILNVFINRKFVCMHCGTKYLIMK